MFGDVQTCKKTKQSLNLKWAGRMTKALTGRRLTRGGGGGASMLVLMIMGIMKMMGVAVASYLSGTFPGPPEQHSLNIY